MLPPLPPPCIRPGMISLTYRRYLLLFFENFIVSILFPYKLYLNDNYINLQIGGHRDDDDDDDFIVETQQPEVIKLAKKVKRVIDFSDVHESSEVIQLGAKKNNKPQDLHVMFSTPDSIKPQTTGSTRRKPAATIDFPPVR